ncbi:MAG: DNA-formamidopyrimidine glycosylase [Synechococcaceae cyanobacterium RL_1_2]|nr:DNA-formamidopyrimidine glycosylase [Synechococcaceae cyanobacterium RL_1_2]
MPELPEVETVCRGLNQKTLRQPLTTPEVLLARSLAWPSMEQFQQAIAGNKFERWFRRGKYILATMADQSHVGVHLRMTGQLLWLKSHEPLQKHTRVRFLFEGDRELRFVDTRTFGKVWHVPPGQPVETIITGLQKLGPEPWAEEFTPAYVAEQLQRRNCPIKTVLLNQMFVAGLGNIYADEVLFVSGIKPDTSCRQIHAKQIPLIHHAIQEVLTKAINKGGTTFSDFLNLLGVSGNYGDVAWVYGRTGKPCKTCGTAIEKIKLGGRSSHFCPQCQR